MTLNIVAVPVFCAAGIGSMLALFAWRRHDIPGARPFALLSLAGAVYALGYTFEISSYSLPNILLYLKIEYLGISMIPAFLIIFALSYTGRSRRLSAFTLAAIFFIPFVTLFLVWSAGSHELFYRNIQLNTAGPFPVISFTRGPWYWVYVAYMGLATVYSNVLFIQMWLNSSRIYHRQIAAVVTASLIPWAAHLIYQTRQGAWVLDLAPFALTLSGVLFFLALFKFQLFSLVPIALRTLYQSLPDGILVFDRHNQLVDANGPAQNYLKVTKKDMGSLADMVLSNWPDIRDLLRNSDGNIRAEMKCDFHGSSGWFELELFPLYDQRQSDTGRMMVIRDISVRKEAEEALRYQLEFEKMVAQVSATFINVPSAQLNLAINEALRLTGEFFRVDRSYIFVFSADGETMNNTNEWFAEGIEPQMEKLQDFPVSALPWWGEQIYNSDYVYIPDVDKLPPGAEAEKKEFKRQDIRSLLTIPISKEGRVAGFLGFDSVRRKKTWPEEQVSLLRVIAEIIFSALKKYHYELHLEYVTFNDSLTGLYNRSYFNNELKRFSAAREYPITIITTDLNGLKLVNDTMGHAEGDELLKEYANLVKGCLRGSDILARVGGDELAALLPRTGREAAAEIISRIRSRENQYNREARLPLSIAVGMSAVENNDTPLEEAFREADDLMYRDKLQHGASARAQITGALLSSMEERNFTSASQIQYLNLLCQQMGEKLNLPPRQLSNLSLLVRAHDLGNLSIPDHILFKNEQLTEEEWEIMRQHPEKGFRIAKFTPELSGIADLILRHHEKWDGSGYPLKIKGGQIPIECRILAIVDAYDAMTTQRPYREASNREQAVAEIKKNSGSQFDPQLVDIFLAVLQEQS